MKLIIQTIVIALLGLSVVIEARAQVDSQASRNSAPTGQKRTQIRLQKEAVGKFNRPSALMRAISLQPVLNANDEVACMRISEIRDPMVREIYKARVGDCLSEIRIFHHSRQGLSSDLYRVDSATDALVLYKDLIGAQRVDIDLKRNDKIVSMSYVVE